MASSGGASSKGLAGKKRKAPRDVLAIREPRRGLGVAELESIRALLETADAFYLAPSLSTPPAAAAAAPPPPLPSLVGQEPGVRYVRNGTVQRDYCVPYYGAQHYTNDVFTRFLHAFPRQKYQADQTVFSAIPTLEQPASSEESYKLQLQDHRRRAQPRQHGQMRRPQVASVDLVDSDDATAAVEELDLELKL